MPNPGESADSRSVVPAEPGPPAAGSFIRTAMHMTNKVYLSLTLTLFSLLICADAAFSQFFVFGKNRVQYEVFDWRYIQTDHFDIYYYGEENYHLAQFTAESVESGLAQLMDDFGHALTNRIPVIIYDSHSDFSQTNVVALPVDAQGIGGVTDKYKNRMTQPFMGDYADFRRTLQHELLHAVVNDMYYGGGLQAMMRNNIQLVLPLWFEEGLAEYLALGWDTQTDMYIRDAVINNYLPPLYQLSGYFSYRGGQSFWNFIAEEYGRSKITEILQRLRQTRNVQQVLMQATGLSLEDLSSRWMDSLQRRYFPEVAERQAVDQIAARVSERGRYGSYNTSPAISPRGDRIAFISNRRGVFDIVVVDAYTGRHLKTVVKGETSEMFEELNILNPNLSWSPDGTRLTLSTKSEGKYALAIVNYDDLKAQLIQFPDLDAVNSVAWSPDGTKIAFDGNQGGYQNIYVYDLQTEELYNLTNDVFTNRDPAWGPDSETVYFVSNRGDRLRAGEHLAGYSILQHEFAYQTDLYSIRVGSNRIERLTNTPWSESSPDLTADGRMVFVSDQNGIPNVYEYDFETRTWAPLTDVRTGISQISISDDGSRLAFNALQDGYLDLFLMSNPLDRRMNRELTLNYWGERRASESVLDRVPATRHAMEMIRRRDQGNVVITQPLPSEEDPLALSGQRGEQGADAGDRRTERQTPVAAGPDSVGAEGLQPGTEPDGTEEGERDEGGRIGGEPGQEPGPGQEPAPQDTSGTPPSGVIDFRNYVFGEAVIQDTTLNLTDNPRQFQPMDNLTDDGRYRPKKYRLSLSPDITYAAGEIDTYYGGSAFAMITLSDLFGDHTLSLGTDLVFDLRDSDYIIQYGYFRQRTNLLVSFFHQAQNYQTRFGELLRFRTFGAGIEFQYPFNRFQRIDYGVSWIGIARDFSSVTGVGTQNLVSEVSTFLYPQITWTSDYTIPGFITPLSGPRYSLRLSGSPPVIPDAPLFVSLLGDYRRYFHLGRGYTFAMRGTGAVSVGPDSQTFFMGGMLGWINQRWSDNQIPFERLADTFFTQPATPLRGHEFNTLFGNKFTMVNSEFRFPLFAAVLPGPIPFLPLYNITGVTFLDAGTAWGYEINYSLANQADGTPIVYHQKPAGLDFRVAKREEVRLVGDPSDPRFGLPRLDGTPDQRDRLATYVDGDILIGAGFGLRTILLGLPFRYDVGWAYERDGFRRRPIHYFSIGIDF